MVAQRRFERPNGSWVRRGVPAIEVRRGFAALVAHRRAHTDVAAQELMHNVGPNKPAGDPDAE